MEIWSDNGNKGERERSLKLRQHIHTKDLMDVKKIIANPIPFCIKTIVVTKKFAC